MVTGATLLYLKKSSFWGTAEDCCCLSRRQKNQSAKRRAMTATAPPTAPPTMAPKFWGCGTVVGDGELLLVLRVLDDRDEVEVGEEGGGVKVSADVVGVLLAKAPMPVSIGVGPI